MALSPATMNALRAAANGFGTRAHEHSLADALQSLLTTRDPVAMLRLLRALWGSSYAGRDQQRDALDQVGLWIEDRLHREPRVPVEALALEIGWLRRLSRAVQREPPAAPTALHADLKPHQGRTPPPRASRPRGRDTASEARFGKRIDAIERRRNEARPAGSMPGSAPVPAAPPLPPPPPPPDRLPSVFEVELVNPLEAREARKTKREREKHKKPPKDRLLPARPTDPRLATLGAGLVLSIMHPAFESLFTGPETPQGGPRAFHVTTFAERDEKKHILTFALEATASAPILEAADTRSPGDGDGDGDLS